MGRIIFELRQEKVPETAANFLTLCGASAATNGAGSDSAGSDSAGAGTNGVSGAEDRPSEPTQSVGKGSLGSMTSSPASTYKGTFFHRIIPDFMCQGGDFENATGAGPNDAAGTGGWAPAAGAQRRWLADEFIRFNQLFCRECGSKGGCEHRDHGHSGAGILSMANAGRPNTNGSQFFVTTKVCNFLDGKHVVFGQVVSGYAVIRAIEAIGQPDGKPRLPVRIENCGVLRESSWPPEEEWTDSQAENETTTNEETQN
eukprot:SAG31_NODE_659_length_13095_cov_4.439597_5_plen_257_part_00